MDYRVLHCGVSVSIELKYNKLGVRIKSCCRRVYVISCMVMLTFNSSNLTFLKYYSRRMTSRLLIRIVVVMKFSYLITLLKIFVWYR